MCNTTHKREHNVLCKKSSPLVIITSSRKQLPMRTNSIMVSSIQHSVVLSVCLLRPKTAFIPSAPPRLFHEQKIASSSLKSRCSTCLFLPHGSIERTSRRCRRVMKMAGNRSKESKKAKPTSEDPSLAVKAAWYGSELFGNIVGMGKSKANENPTTSAAEEPSTIPREEAAARLKTDFDRSYFVTGQMDLDLYEEDCTFADPFVAFQGRERFKNNLDNLGSFMQDVSLDVTGWDNAESSLKTKWRFRCVLGLPWRPTLAASGGTEFFFSDSGRIERHVESWDIEPVDALKQLIKPGRKPKKSQ